jgi:probable phosphoglycerate mutase
VLWRHGRTAWNANGRFQGQLDPPLDDVGHAQARAAAEVLASVGVSAILSSDLARASATAEALASVTGLPPTLDPRLREVHLGAWQGLSREDVETLFPDEYAAWLAGEDVRRGDGETYVETGQRAASAVREGLDRVPPDGVLVVVTHGGAVRATLGVMLEIDPASWWRFAPLANCRWSVLTETPRGWRLAEHAAGSPPDEVVRGDDR